jgi:hypothetical protein
MIYAASNALATSLQAQCLKTDIIKEVDALIRDACRKGSTSCRLPMKALDISVLLSSQGYKYTVSVSEDGSSVILDWGV